MRSGIKEFFERCCISPEGASTICWFFVIAFAFFTALFLSLIQSVYPSPPYLQALVDVYLTRRLTQELAFYLLLYSVMSVVPLMFMLVFVPAGFSSSRFKDFFNSHLRTFKIAASALFLAIGTGLLYQLDKFIFGG